ncbi:MULTISPECIES: serine/threonine protein kinase [unclassified Acinetobacter]|uniref:serine/threonine protein kinase n=1 Tax=unclassified Acinetobacter TaxID=196816 RepID=UPI002934B6EE|nr:MULTISPECIES: protein kinase [unclassified Acinetobacter]WOE32546.1 protein kinase [Acinetobacter sp. SAAs470]WOE38022.1 protein kinase [Acinetobacter sp. SAAs474]
MQILNSFQFKPINIRTEYLQLKSTAQSLAYGRFLYEYQDQGQHYWLKCQAAGHPQYQLGFQRELDFYQSVVDEHLAEIVLPYAICQFTAVDSAMVADCDCLITPHSQPLFQHSPDDLSFDELIHQLLQILAVLERLHQQGWIHGDLKKEHFVFALGRVKLFDFEHCVNVNQTQQGHLTATPRYMAPELFRHAAKSYASDVYALGIILLEWLTQQRLVAKSYQQWAILHCQSLIIELPARFQCLYGILSAMLQKDPLRRTVDFSVLKKRLILDIV